PWPQTRKSAEVSLRGSPNPARAPARSAGSVGSAHVGEIADRHLASVDLDRTQVAQLLIGPRRVEVNRVGLADLDVLPQPDARAAQDGGRGAAEAPVLDLSLVVRHVQIPHRMGVDGL